MERSGLSRHDVAPVAPWEPGKKGVELVKSLRGLMAWYGRCQVPTQICANRYRASERAHEFMAAGRSLSCRESRVTRRIARAAAVLLGAALAAPVLSQSAPPTGVDLSARDTSVRPGDDFFRYALGNWYSQAQIPPDQTEIGAYPEVTARVREQLRVIIEDSARQADSPEKALIGGLFSSFMDAARIESLDAAPLRADLDRIAHVANKEEFLTLMASAPGSFFTSLFWLRIEADAKSPTNVLYVGQGGLGLSNPEYYLSSAFSSQKAAYGDYIARTLRLVGYAAPEANAAKIVDLETAIAKVSWSQTQRRDIAAAYNPTTVVALQALAPGISWRKYLDAVGARDTGSLVLAEKSAIVAMTDLYARSTLPVLKAWQTFHTVDNASRFLSGRFVNNHFAFRGTAQMGVRELPDRWKRGVDLVNASLGEALGRLYVAENFSPEAKQQMEILIGELRRAMARRIESLDWMSDTTKQQALAKLAAMRVFVGYPERWRDDSGLSIDRKDLYGNVKRSRAFDWASQCATLGHPIDKSAWGPVYWRITPQTVDAFNIASENLIIFPAAILQPPFFDPKVDAAHNYGDIGAVIGHEITHGFDDQGRKIDASGKLRDWWTPADAMHFEQRAEQLARQYDGYEVLPGLHVHGRQTLGENIADLGGVLLALDAYHASLGGAQAPVLDGLSGDQRFFLSYAQRARTKMRDDALRNQIAMDTHAPLVIRASAPLRDIDDWYTAFDVRPSDKNYLPPAQRVRIW
jgi:putative endopeptidase